MRAVERFLQYVTMDTTSDRSSQTHPSTVKQLVLAKKLADEMKTLGMQGVRVCPNGYVYGFIPASEGCEAAPSLGFVTHMDTSPDARGDGVKPVVHENYDGGDVHLPSGRVLRADVLRLLPGFKGQTLITASGDTLLGADDKAGIAEVMTLCEEVLCGQVPHGRLCVAFTPDEEIGRGTDDFDVQGFGAQYAYTVDGGLAGEICYENFNAADATVAFTGVEVHPGEAEGVMVNAVRLAARFDASLPQQQSPENTSGRQGFIHLNGLCGEVGRATASYIIRDHDRDAFEAKKRVLQHSVQAFKECYGDEAVALEMQDIYYNMGAVIKQHFHLVEVAREATRAAGLVPQTLAIRGGTDGAILSLKGLPCPNLGTGGVYYHGPNECITAEGMDQVVAILLGIVERYAHRRDEGPLED